MLSLPRDLWVPIAGPNGEKAKINSAYADGPDVLAGTVTDASASRSTTTSRSTSPGSSSSSTRSAASRCASHYASRRLRIGAGPAARLSEPRRARWPSPTPARGTSRSGTRRERRLQLGARQQERPRSHRAPAALHPPRRRQAARTRSTSNPLRLGDLIERGHGNVITFDELDRRARSRRRPRQRGCRRPADVLRPGRALPATRARTRCCWSTGPRPTRCSTTSAARARCPRARHRRHLRRHGDLTWPLPPGPGEHDVGSRTV